ncbi:glycoside hydrolase/phage tail family protein [Hyphomonas sp. FCG-A18]|uniref:baseplate multidomain protein megatron n=1 Tax=Hyphomonas sp. FCG-A18 TaxID=3080019 RepID=UPI002B304998|nr:glycoside hydrolase/phage tail family protein [Hyphomonas sp. FCG-A18]
MAEIALTQAGAALGSTLLPNGLSILGQTISGAAIGRFAGSLAGRAIDASLAPPLEGPRVKSLHVMESREGAGLPTVYGRYRVGGQVIWASRFREKREERSGGKGGPRYTEYSYTVSFAVALCEGPITRVDRIWANNEPLALNDVTWRLYQGHEDQVPDPLIEAIEGSGQAPAYRGVAYIVFEDLPLEAFGNRLPQLSFEVVRAGEGHVSTLRDVVRGVNIIPASGEFVYGTQVVRERRFPGIERALNMNNGDGRSDFSVSVDQLKADLPRVSTAALTVAWFGTDTRAGVCQLKPGVETYERGTVPYAWQVDGIVRGAAHLISKDENGNAVYGGTPADTCVLEGIAALHAAGIAVTLSPFILMDSAGFPWRGRITAEADGTSAARAEIEALVGLDGGFGFRHFILHHARLAQRAAEQGTPIESFLLGSELVGLTRVRDNQGRFPFVEALVDLAQEVREIVGPAVKISYAADWTEYGAYVPQDGSSDVLFPLDALWASPHIDFVGVDWYPPAGDWRDGDGHLDAIAGYQDADDAAYLVANMAGGEGYDWYYANTSDRDNQVRTPIIDTGYGEHWVFRPKDLIGWWQNAHFERPDGARAPVSTAWVPASKPVRLIEIGFPAVDRGGNGPNVFYDPKSSESAFPPYSHGQRDDLYQRRALEAALGFWQAQGCVEQALVWAWDGRPFPYWPNLTPIWSDGPNWQYGHWLNGRTGLISLDEIVEDLARRAGVSVDTSALAGFVDGYALEGVSDLRTALAPLEAAFAIQAIERDGILTFRQGRTRLQILDLSEVVEGSLQFERQLLDKRPGRLVVTYINGEGGYDASTAEARSDKGDRDYTIRLSLPVVLGGARARDLAGRLLSEALLSENGQVSLGPAGLKCEPGDRLQIDGVVWSIDTVRDVGLRRDVGFVPMRGGDILRAVEPPSGGESAQVRAEPEMVVIDAVPGEGPFVGVTARPWGRRIRVFAGPDVSNLSERAVFDAPIAMGQLVAPLQGGPIGRWDKANDLVVEVPGADLSSVTRLAALAGANRMFVEGHDRWELIAFSHAELIGENVWRLSDLLRGQSGTRSLVAMPGARVVLADSRLQQVVLEDQEVGLNLTWRANDAAPFVFTYEARGNLPLPVAHVRRDRNKISWTRRGRDVSDNWLLPDAVNTGNYLIEWLDGDTILQASETQQAHIPIQNGANGVRIAQRGADGRIGPWVSISLNAP